MQHWSTYEKFIVYGTGITGAAAVRFFEKNGRNSVVVTDGQSPQENFREKWLKEPQAIKVNKNTLVIVSPGVALEKKSSNHFYHRWLKEGVTVATDIDLFLQTVSKDVICVGITGTNGKTTTTLLTEKIFNELGCQAVTAGNIGRSPLDLEPSKAVVLELSSFQLSRMRLTPRLNASVILNVAPDHLDQHQTFNAYVVAKKKLFDLTLGKCFLSQQALQVFKNEKIELTKNTVILESMISELKPLGLESEYTPSRQENILASCALAKAVFSKLDKTKVLKSLNEFVWPQHRQSFVAMFQGHHFVDDSKATNWMAARTALKSYSNILWLAGGVLKEDLDSRALAPLVSKIKQVFCFGQDRLLISDFCTKAGATARVFKTLEEAVTCIFECLKKEKDPCTVLLSPMGTSFDHYKSYAERGSAYARFVELNINMRKSK